MTKHIRSLQWGTVTRLELQGIRAQTPDHGDPEGGTFLLNPNAGLSVRWTADGDLKTVYIEEFLPLPDPTSEWVFVRYLHAFRDTVKHVFVHCDGAVKAYATDRYPQVQHNFKHRGKRDR